jgi:hypothetical protein
VEITNGGNGESSYCFISGISGRITIENSSVGPLSVQIVNNSDGSGGSTNTTIINSSFANLTV